MDTKHFDRLLVEAYDKFLKEYKRAPLDDDELIAFIESRKEEFGFFKKLFKGIKRTWNKVKKWTNDKIKKVKNTGRRVFLNVLVTPLLPYIALMKVVLARRGIRGVGVEPLRVIEKFWNEVVLKDFGHVLKRKGLYKRLNLTGKSYGFEDIEEFGIDAMSASAVAQVASQIVNIIKEIIGLFKKKDEKLNEEGNNKPVPIDEYTTEVAKEYVKLQEQQQTQTQQQTQQGKNDILVIGLIIGALILLTKK